MRQLTSFSIRSVLDRVPNASTCNANYELEYRSMPKSGRRTPIFFRDEKRFLDILSGWKGPACWGIRIRTHEATTTHRNYRIVGILFAGLRVNKNICPTLVLQQPKTTSRYAPISSGSRKENRRDGLSTIGCKQSCSSAPLFGMSPSGMAGAKIGRSAPDRASTTPPR